MTEKLIFWAQALDNSSPDHIDVHGEALAPDEKARRENAASLISKVIKSGTQVFKEQGVLLTVNSYQFVVEVLSEQPDHAGRSAPIVCYGEYAPAFDDSFGDSVAVEIDEFAHKIGRTLLPEHFELARNAFTTLKKKSSMKRLASVVGVGAVVLILSALVWHWLASSGSLNGAVR